MFDLTYSNWNIFFSFEEKLVEITWAIERDVIVEFVPIEKQ